MANNQDRAPKNIPSTHCFITTHDAEGKAIFYDKPEDVIMKNIGVADFNVLFTTNQVPHQFDEDQDVRQYLDFKGVVPISMQNGTVARMVDLAPGEASPMHRTTSLDYGVVLEGEIELILEDFEKGPKRLMRRGDVSVQRATAHAWRNPSRDQWTRMLYVLVDAKPFLVGGQRLPDDHGDIELPEQ